MSTEIPQSRKINIEPASTEELRAAFLVEGEADTDKTTDNTAANEAYNKALQEELERQKKLDGKNRTKNMTKFVLVAGGVATVGAGGAVVASEISASANHPIVPQVETAQPTHSAGDILPTAQATSGALDLSTSSPSPANTTPLETAPVLTPAEKIKQSLEIPVGLAPLELGKKLAADISAWEMAGASQELIDKWDVHMTIEQYTAKVAADQADTYKTAIFGDTTDPAILALVDKITKENADNLYVYMTTAGSNDPENVESFTTATRVESLVSSSEHNGVVSVTVNSYGENNGDKNNYGRLNHIPTKIPSVIHASFTPLPNKTMQVTALSVSSR